MSFWRLRDIEKVGEIKQHDFPPGTDMKKMLHRAANSAAFMHRKYGRRFSCRTIMYSIVIWRTA